MGARFLREWYIQYSGDVLSVFQTPGLLTNLEPDQPGVCTVGRGGGRGKGEGEPIAEPIFSVKI